MSTRKWHMLACGIGLQPFWWQWGRVHGVSGTMLALGPLRIAFRGWS